MTEQELASRCAQGDNAARKELYLTYGPRMRALCRRYAASAADAEDLLQEAFIKIFRVIGRYKWTRPGSLYSWMTRVTLNMAIDSAKIRRRMNHELTDMETLADAPADEPQYEDTASIPSEVLHAMIEDLPEACRTVFKLYCLDNYSHMEIASLLGIKENSSSSMLAKARAALTRSIKKYLEKKK